MLRYHIDSILIRRNYLLLIGWGFLQGRNVTRLTLKLNSGSEAPDLEIEVEHGRRRDDVKTLFSDVPEAENSGFVLFAGFDQKNITRALLQWELDEKEVLETTIDFWVSQKRKPVDVIKQYSLLLFKALKLIRSTGVVALVHKARIYLSAKPKSARDSGWKSLYARIQGRPLTVV